MSPKASLFLLRVPVSLIKDTISLWNLPFYQGIILSNRLDSEQSYLLGVCDLQTPQNFCTNTDKAQDAVDKVLNCLHSLVDASLGMELIL